MTVTLTVALVALAFVLGFLAAFRFRIRVLFAQRGSHICACVHAHKCRAVSMGPRFALYCNSCNGHCGDCDSLIVEITEHVKPE